MVRCFTASHGRITALNVPETSRKHMSDSTHDLKRSFHVCVCGSYSPRARTAARKALNA